MDFMKPDLTTVHKEEPLLAIRLCSQHVSALLGWAIAHAGQWNRWRLYKCIWPAPGSAGVLALSYQIISSEYIPLETPLIEELCQLEKRLIRSDRESLWTRIRMYHSIKELLSYSCNSFMY